MNAPVETEHNVNYQVLRLLIDERHNLYQNQFAAAKEAITIAQIASEKRFDSINEFRKTLSDQTLTFIPRSEAEIRMKALEESIKTLSLQQTHGSGQMQGAYALWAALGGMVLLAVAVGTFVLNYLQK